MTRHAEKLTVQNDLGLDNCTPDGEKCEEALSPLGEKRAQLLAEWFENQGIIDDITHVISSDKQRTRQTVQPTAQKVRDLGRSLPDIDDTIDDGVVQLPAFDANMEGNELSSNSKSVVPMAQAILDLPAGSVAVVAAHSGTIYRILGGEDTDGNPLTGEDDSVGLGIDTTIGNNFDEVTLFPKKESDGKVPTFGDVWRIVINNNTGNARVAWRKNLQLQRLRLENLTTYNNGVQRNRSW
jgi:broad specificity phosphatase PhoE